MATAAGTRRPLLSAGRTDPLVDIGIAPPRVRWSLTHEDRKKGVIIAGGQGSGKSATLQKFVEGDVLSPNTATIVFDMKGSLAERLLRLIPADLPKRYFDHSAQLWRDGTKRVWYLDLADPAFGLTPLHPEPGWTLARLPNEFVRIAGMVVHALMDLFEDQIFQSSQDIIERSVIGTMAIAWFEHDERHRKAGTNPEQHGFGGSFEVLHKMLAPTDRLASDGGDRRGRRGTRPRPATEASAQEWNSIRRPERGTTDGHPVPEHGQRDVAVGGARIERNPPRPAPTTATAIELFDWAMRPTECPAPRDDLPALPGVVADAVAYAASVEQITALGDWKNAHDAAIKDAEAAARAARSTAALEARADGISEQKIESVGAAAANAARRRELAKHTEAAWQTDITTVTLSAQEQQILEVLARLPLSAAPVLAALLNKPAKERRLRQLLREGLHDRGLISASALTLERRGGRPATVYAVSARGREWLRLEHQKLRGDQPPPDYLRSDRSLPAPGRGSTVPHTLAVQLVIGALRQFGGTDVKTVWWTPMMPGGRLDVGMAHSDRRDKRIRLEDLTGRSGLTVIGDALSTAPGVVEPDATVQMTGHVAGQRRSLKMLLEIDRTGDASYNTNKLIAYDHFLAGWCLRTRTFATARPLVVFVAQSPRSALRLLARAHDVTTLGIGISGHDRQTYQYYGRTHTAFTCIDWILGGQAYALRMAPVPPETPAGALACDAEAVALLPEAWWPKQPTSAAGGRH